MAKKHRVRLNEDDPLPKKAEKYRTLKQKELNNLIKAGQVLREVGSEISDAEWRDWVVNVLGVKHTTAAREVRMAEFAEKVEGDNLANLSPSVLLSITRTSVLKEVRDKVLELVNSGQHVSEPMVEEIIADRKQSHKKLSTGHSSRILRGFSSESYSILPEFMEVIRDFLLAVPRKRNSRLLEIRGNKIAWRNAEDNSMEVSDVPWGTDFEFVLNHEEAKHICSQKSDPVELLASDDGVSFVWKDGSWMSVSNKRHGDVQDNS